MNKFWQLFRGKPRTQGRTQVEWLIAGGYNVFKSPVDDTQQLWDMRAPELERAREAERTRDRRRQGEPQKLRRGQSQRNKKIKHEDLHDVLSRLGPVGSMPDLLEDEIIPGKAIVLKMPERSVKSYFIPLPIDLDVHSLVTVLKSRA
jgi:hypothetical protein